LTIDDVGFLLGFENPIKKWRTTYLSGHTIPILSSEDAGYFSIVLILANRLTWSSH
jgi:hypothetical protein